MCDPAYNEMAGSSFNATLNGASDAAFRAKPPRMMEGKAPKLNRMRVL